MMTIACTGGIGVGKTYLATIFGALGFSLYFSDQRTKELYVNNLALRGELIELLGEEIFDGEQLNRAVMASKIFSDRELLKRVNAIVHPKVLEDFIEWRKQEKERGATHFLLESAIYFDVPLLHSVVDKVLLVVAPEKVRIDRIIKRDSLSEEAIRARMASQPKDEELIERADFVIYSGDGRALLPQVIKVIESCNIDIESLKNLKS